MSSHALPQRPNMSNIEAQRPNANSTAAVDSQVTPGTRCIEEDALPSAPGIRSALRLERGPSPIELKHRPRQAKQCSLQTPTPLQGQLPPLTGPPSTESPRRRDPFELNIAVFPEVPESTMCRVSPLRAPAGSVIVAWPTPVRKPPSNEDTELQRELLRNSDVNKENTAPENFRRTVAIGHCGCCCWS